WSESSKVVIGIDPRPGMGAGSAGEVYIDRVSGAVSSSIDLGYTGEPVLALALNDQHLVRVGFVYNSTRIDIGEVSGFRMAIKEFEPDNPILLGGGTDSDTTYGRD